jgi:hypothetical protein
MTTLREAAQQALEALMWHDETVRTRGDNEAIAALRAALAQEEPRNQCGETCERAKLCAVCARGLEQEQEPVAWMDEFGNAFPLGAVKGAGSWRDDHQRNWTPLYTHPPRREWVLLTEEGLAELARQEELLLICDDFDALKEIARAIEQACKERNT